MVGAAEEDGCRSRIAEKAGTWVQVLSPPIVHSDCQPLPCHRPQFPHESRRKCTLMECFFLLGSDSQEEQGSILPSSADTTPSPQEGARPSLRASASSIASWDGTGSSHGTHMALGRLHGKTPGSPCTPRLCVISVFRKIMVLLGPPPPAACLLPAGP